MSESRSELEREIATAQEELDEARRKKLVKLRRQLPPEPVRDYELRNAGGPVKISEMFGDKEDLILIHNMGAGCSYCTLWADEFNGVFQHLQSRTGFVVVSPDSPEHAAGFREEARMAVPNVLCRGHDVYKGYGLPMG